MRAAGEQGGVAANRGIRGNVVQSHKELEAVSCASEGGVRSAARYTPRSGEMEGCDVMEVSPARSLCQ